MRKIVVLFILLFILIFVCSCGYSSHHGNNYTVINDDIIQQKGFYVSADSSAMMTSVQGTVYVRGNNTEPKNIQVIASIQIDPNDWGGVVFYFTDGWNVSGITSSYPEKDTQAAAKDYVAMWTTADAEAEWNKMVEIGRDRSYVPTGGGTGTIVIDLVLGEKTSQNSKTFRCLVGVGADEKNGVKIAAPDSITVELPL
jgi:hypothetical protein